MTKTPGKDVVTTSDALMHEFNHNNWNERLSQCRNERKDTITEYELGEKEYKRRILSEHYENGVLIAFSITYEFHAGNSVTRWKMLRIDGIPHRLPSW